MTRAAITAAVVLVAGTISGLARGQSPSPDVRRTVTYRFTPTARAQMALWLESADGTRFATLGLTQATAKRGIGNRPGASQMNSGYHWPYGRREGVLPIWAHRRAAAPGAAVFKRVIFQDRTSEGRASQAERHLSSDSSPDTYFCLSFDVATTRRDALDAVSCATAFNGDKGRFLGSDSTDTGYSEPWQEGNVGSLRVLDWSSLYPPRTDVTRVGVDHADVADYPAEVRRVLPNLDAISMATPPGGTAQALEFEVPRDWPDGDGFAFLEINTEGDYAPAYNDTLLPTPTLPTGAWDVWATDYGYPFRGQPSVVFRLPVRFGDDGTQAQRDPIGYGSLDGIGPAGGDIHALDATITNDAERAPGSGADRLRLRSDGMRLVVENAVGAAPRDGGTDGDAAPSDGSATGDAAPRPAVCDPGRTLACACVGGAQGAQTCSDDGTRYEACQCPTSTPSGGGCGCDLGATGGGGGDAALPLVALLLLLLLDRARLASRARAR